MTPERERTLPALLERQASRFGERPLARWEQTTLSFSATRDRAASVACGLAAAGVRPGDRVAALSANRLELLELWLGCAWLGAVFVPVNVELRGTQLAHVLLDAAPRLLFQEDELAELPRGDPVAAHPVEPADPAVILYTSGTTGPAKGVVCPHAQWWWWAEKTGGVLGVTAESVLYTCLPLAHTNALNAFCQALVSGATFVLGPRFSASAFWSRVREADASVTYLLGPMASILAARPPGPDDRAHRVEVALAPATPAELHDPFLQRFGVRLLDAWGSTETNIVLSNTLEDHVPGSLGRLVDPFEARVLADTGDELPDGEPGELAVRTREPLAFSLGYLGCPPRGEWVETGDRVVRDEDDRFWFVDRLKDGIRRRGENVSSYDVEQALLAHRDVAVAAVIAVPSDLGEDDVMAWVVPREGAELVPEELLVYLEPRLARFALPRYVQVASELPSTASGKIEKFRLRERGVQATTWDRERAG